MAKATAAWADCQLLEQNTNEHVFVSRTIRAFGGYRSRGQIFRVHTAFGLGRTVGETWRLTHARAEGPS
jgi:hypothetical protein